MWEGSIDFHNTSPLVTWKLKPFYFSFFGSRFRRDKTYFQSPLLERCEYSFRLCSLNRRETFVSNYDDHFISPPYCNETLPRKVRLLYLPFCTPLIYTVSYRRIVIYRIKFQCKAYYENRTIPRLEVRIAQHLLRPVRKHMHKVSHLSIYKLMNPPFNEFKYLPWDLFWWMFLCLTQDEKSFEHSRIHSSYQVTSIFM